VGDVTEIAAYREVTYRESPPVRDTADDAADVRCNVCAEVVEQDDESLVGKAFFFRHRGEQPEYETEAVCASCAVAIGLSALHRWEIEEEEG
jgi:hypothetical protein